MLRDYQLACVTRAVAGVKDRRRQLFAAPTGTGKSYIENELLDQLPGWWLVTPRVEIIAGMLNKRGVPTEGSLASLVASAAAARITTPLRLRNALMNGGEPPAGLIVDEAHHDGCDTYEQLQLLCGDIPWIGLTATPYRGTPRGTAALRAVWGDPEWVLTYPEAVRQGVLAFPSVYVWPLVDDDKIEVRNGEFVVEAADEWGSRLEAVASRCQAFGQGGWDTPTLFAVPSTEIGRLLQRELQQAGLPAFLLTQNTSTADRREAFSLAIRCKHALIHINTVSEGVDLPLRRLIDLSPTLSPVRWLQQFGRITRPGGSPEYICTNRNLLRHAYLLEGCLPPQAVIDAEAAFKGPGSRLAVRALGLEAIGRFKAIDLPLSNGMTGAAYALSSIEGTCVRDYAVLVHPLRAEPLWATRTRKKATASTAATYGKWEKCRAPEGLQGFSSIPPSPVTPKMAAWWKRSAGRFGLDPEAKITRKNFVALPVLSDTRSIL